MLQALEVNGLPAAAGKVPGLRSTGRKLQLLILQSGDAAVAWAHARTTKPVPPACGERRLRRWTQHPAPALTFPPSHSDKAQASRDATSHRGDTPQHQDGVGLPTAASIVGASELQKRPLFFVLCAQPLLSGHLGKAAARSRTNHHRPPLQNPQGTRI